MTVAASEDRRWFGSTEILVVALIAMALAAGWLRGIVDANEKLATAGTV
ncbi:permease, partial [Mycobacteroides abscessus]